MSQHYYVYAEIKVKDKWYNLNPFVKKYDGTYVLHPIYDKGSAFRDVQIDLEEHRIDVGIPDDMSPELRSIFHENLDEKFGGWIPDMTWRQMYEQSVFCVKYDNTIGVRAFKDKPYKYEGYVAKRTIADFEVGEIESIGHWFTLGEYEALPKEQKRLYRFYRWNEPFDDYTIYRTIYERLCMALYLFDYADAFENRAEYWHAEAGLNDIRLFIEWN